MFALDLLNQFQSYNGTLLAAGKIYVYNLGRTQLATVYGDHNGATPIANPVVLDDQGMAEIYLNDAFNYTIVVYDAYGQEQFSRDIYPKGMGNGESIGTQLYEGVDPIVVNNDLYVISANTTKLGVQEPLYFVQDDEERVIIGFSGQAIPEGTMNESAFGYQDGQITGYNGSAFSAGNSYEAGSYIDIDGNTINVTGLQPAGDYQSAGDYVSASELENLQPKGDYYSASNPSGFITGVDLTDYAKTEDLTAYQEKGNYYSASNPSGFINSDSISAMATTGFVAGVSADITAMIPDTSDMATKTWVSSQGYLTAHQSLDGLMSADLLEISNNKITGYNGTAFAGQGGGGVSGDFELVAGNGIQLTDDPIAQTTTVSVSGDYATNTQLQTVSADITALIPTALTGDYLTKESADTLYAPTGNYLTGLPADVAYTGWVETSIVSATSGLQPSGNYLTTGDSANFYTTANESGFITGVDLTPYQLTADMTGYLTTADSANFLTAVPVGTMNESAFGYDASDNITGYNGSAFAGGSDVPEGVMVESGLEYNAVNEISGYNGSAIAQYGTEKQWFVTDDTLLTLSNSAQFALGVNISAVAQLLGVDETVLFETTSTSGSPMTDTFNLSGSMADYEKIKILYRPWNDSIIPEWFEFDYNKRGNSNIMCRSTTFTINPLRFIVCEFNFSADNSFSVSNVRFADGSFATTTLDKSRGNIYKVIGIGRKS
jgi:hypothetical protein